MVYKGFYGNYCPAGFFKYGMDMHHPDCSAECDKCWSCTADSEWCESGDYEIPEEWKEISAPAQPEAAVPTGKYAEAVQLNAQIMTSARAAQQNLYDMAMGFKKMRDDKLYKELGYDNFGDYCEGKTGMHRKNVYRYIDIVEKLPSNFVSSMTQIGMTKLQLLSTIDEEHRTEIIENTDLESTTVKKLREQIEQLKEKNKLIDSNYKSALNKADKAAQKVNSLKSELNAMQLNMKELESRPVDVQIQQPDEAEISVQAREMAQGLIRSAEAAADMRVREFQQELEKKDKELNELSEKLREAQASVLDAAFESNSESVAEQIREFYEMLHSRALSALRDCFDFIGMDIPSESAKAIRSRLRTFGEVVELYINELEER